MQQLNVIENKILDAVKLPSVLSVWRFREEKIVFTNGCFDILHHGHVDYLSKAKDLGTKLIVGLNTDASVKRQNKGADRPINNENSRLFMLAALHCIDAVILFDEETPLELIKTIQPDVLVKGSDYEIEKIVGYDIVKSKGGLVTTIPLTQGFSTTSILNKLKK